MARMHLFLDEETARRLRKLKKIFGERFAIDTVKKLMDFTEFYFWLQENKTEEFSKLWTEYKKTQEKFINPQFDILPPL
jgi:hypothetical protein